MEKYDPIRVLGEGSFGKVFFLYVEQPLLCGNVIACHKGLPHERQSSTKVCMR